MPEMKDSGIEWIGEIPKEWMKSKIKNICSMIGSGTTPTSSVYEFYNDGNINWIQSGDIYGKTDIFDTSTKITSRALASSSSLKIYKVPYIVIAMYGGSVGNTAISHIDACTNQACCCVKPSEKINFSFLYYWILFCREDFMVKAEGGGQPNISQEKIKNQWIFFPNMDKQKKIAEILDEKCTEIDALSADIQSEIDVLEEYKKSVITETVTKGLESDGVMKDSGIEWIGEIPPNWHVSKIKYHLRRKELRNPGDMQVLSVYRKYGVIPKDSRDDNHNVTSEDTSKYKYVKPGVLVINKMKAWQGSMGISLYEGIVSPAYFIYEFTDETIQPMFLHYLLRNVYKDEFRRISGGIREGQWDLPAGEFENEYIVIPSVNEQMKIIEYLDKTIKYIEDTVAMKKEQLATLEEYKKSIIYEYVTGKKEVPTV